MTALIVVGAIVAYLAAYSYVGYRIARWDLPHLWDRAQLENSSWYLEDNREKFSRQHVNNATIATWLFWPIRLPWLYVAHHSADYDPKVLERRLREIEQLERELHIGGGS